VGRGIVKVVIAFDTYFTVMLGFVIELLTELQAVDVLDVFKEWLSYFLPQPFGLKKGRLTGYSLIRPAVRTGYACRCYFTGYLIFNNPKRPQL